MSIVLITKERYTKFVNSMTALVGVIVLECVHIGDKLKFLEIQVIVKKQSRGIKILYQYTAHSLLYEKVTLLQHSSATVDLYLFYDGLLDVQI